MKLDGARTQRPPGGALGSARRQQIEYVSGRQLAVESQLYNGQLESKSLGFVKRAMRTEKFEFLFASIYIEDNKMTVFSDVGCLIETIFYSTTILNKLNSEFQI